MFQKSGGLPFKRENDYAIMIQEGKGPVRVRSYRYPLYEKDEIERLVREMLMAGIIHPNNSPYSSPMILVKKKDGSWRFCVDYRALNRIIVPDRFPISELEELLHKLHGAIFFFKNRPPNWISRNKDKRKGYCQDDLLNS